MKKDSGYIEFNAVLLLFFIVAVISGGIWYAKAAITYSQTDNHDFNTKLAADILLDEIIAKMQPLRLYQYDDKNNEVITSLCREYEEYGLEFTDISSGYHLDFLSDTDMADSNLARYLFADNTGAAFTAWRNINGLSVSKAVWREFIKEEAWGACVSYGWLYKNDTESFAFRNISRSFAITETEKLFPLVNDFPRMNVNMVNPDILRPLIMRNSFKIERPNEKTDALINRLRSGPILHSDISSILSIPINHPLMSYLGTKTSFWKIRFIMNPSMELEAIIAAIPKKNGNIQEIELYRLIDRSFLND
ncbi:MAG: hypothetical protein FWD36_02705 [Treponema sp.]|nr:hypothetical protein [Treponema sp.]